jgi:hypothetical protein
MRFVGPKGSQNIIAGGSSSANKRRYMLADGQHLELDERPVTLENRRVERRIDRARLVRRYTNGSSYIDMTCRQGEAASVGGRPISWPMRLRAGWTRL